MAHQILVSSYTNDIVTLAFDPATPSVSITSSTTVGHHPSWITAYPDDRSLIFTGLEQTEGKVIALKYGKDGQGRIAAELSSGGADPCTLLATKGELLVGNYSSGSLATFPLSAEAPYLSAGPDTTTLSGSGPNKQRQEAPHAHHVYIVEEYEELLVADLGSDVVVRFKKDEGGSWRVRGQINFEAGGGPRHVAYHDGYLYTLLELTSRIAVHRLPPLPAQPSFVTSRPTLSNPLPLPNDMLASEILIPPTNPTYPTAYIYLTNRNDPSPEGDSISIFSVANPDALELIAEVRTGLKHVRGMAFGGPEDKWVIVGGVNSGGVKVFERVDGGKDLKLVAANESVQAPTGFLWL